MEQNVTTEVKDYEFTGSVKTVSLGLIVVGIISLLVSFSLNRTVGWVDYLVSTLWVTTIAVSGVFFLAVTGVLQASWITPYKRVPEAMIKFLPIAAVLMAAVYFGMHTIYEWTHADVVAADPILRTKTWWLTTPGFVGRLVLIFAVWIFMAWKFNSLSDIQEARWSPEVTQRIVRFSCVALILFALSICVAAFDWIMSIEPHWFSTIFGVYVFAGTFVSGISMVTLIVLHLRDKGYLRNVVNENHLHDLGKWMFGMSTFWAYIWISQYLLIWYANIPEETEYYVLRSHHGWNVVFFFNLFINWVFPFFMLMTRGAKRSPGRLKLVAMVLLIGHFIDLYLMVAPMVFHHHEVHLTGYGILQVLQLFGFGGLFVFFTGRALTKRKLVSTNDPNFAEGVHLHQ